MALNQEQLETLGRAHHRGDAVACPLCTARLHVDERGYGGRVSVPLRFICPRDGILGDFEPPDLRTPWPDSLVIQVLNDYLRHGEARCPEDQAKLRLIYEAHESGEYLCAMCPSCGRVFEGPINSRAPQD